MSWNISFSVLPDTDLAALNPEGPALSFDTATDAYQLVGAQVGDRVMIIDPFYGTAARIVAQHVGAQLYTVSLGGASDTYAIEALGPVSRLRVLSDGEVVEDQGDPLPAESALAGHEDDEDAHFAVLETLLGAPFAVFQQAEFRRLPFSG